MTSADTEILTVEDLAAMFDCDEETASARLICGDLPGLKVGRGWIIPRQALFERLNEMAAEEARYLADRIVSELYDLPTSGVARPAAPAAPAVDADPLDVCTDPYNCARCKTHPAHRGDMHHAGISGKGGSA